jgi:hypothetical protein
MVASVADGTISREVSLMTSVRITSPGILTPDGDANGSNDDR